MSISTGCLRGAVGVMAVVAAGAAAANDVPSPYAGLQVGIADVGQDLPITVSGAHSARFALAASPRGGFRHTPYGTLCLDRRHAVVLVNGLPGSGPTLDATGRYTYLVHVPARVGLLGRAPVFQAAVADVRAVPYGIALSRSETRVIGNGSRGDFRGPAVVPLPGNPNISGAVQGDVDHDGATDLVVWDGHHLLLLLGDGQGGFVDGTNGSTTGLPNTGEGTITAALVDVDGDGDLDLVYAGSPASPQDYRVRLLINDGQGRFTDGTDGTTTGFPVPGPRDGWLYGLLVADFDRDGSPDLIVIGDWRIYLNDGHGRFRDVRGEPGHGWDSATAPTPATAWKGTTGDFDGNGTTDFIAVATGTPPHLYLNDGNAYFREGTNGPTTSLPPWPDPFLDDFTTFAAGDIDRDDDLDLVAMTSGGQSRTWINHGGGNFVDETFVGPHGEPPRLPLRQTGSGAVCLLDVDRDGDLDLFQGSSNDLGNELYLNDGNGYFSDTRGNLVAGAPAVRTIRYWCFPADIDGDGDLDIVAQGSWTFASGYTQVAIFVNR
jgi:VCBS repeat protein